jgi:hypothetical protein
MLNFDSLRTPRQDGEVLIEPAAALWAGLIEQNLRSRIQDSSLLHLAGVGLEEVRHATRTRLFGPDVVEPIIACGHQPEFAHPGVWAKHMVVRDVASHLGLRGVDLVVDNDAPRSTAIVLPAVDSQGFVSRDLIPVLNGVAGAAHEARPPLSPTAIDTIQRRTAGTLAGTVIPNDGRLADKALVFQYFRGMASQARPRDFVEQHLAGRARIDRLLLADLQEVRVSEAFDGPFVADILLNLERFAREYNTSLAEYRRDQQVRSPDRPLPDLKRTDERLEAPFWIYQPLQQRRRMWIASRGDAIDIYADQQLAGTVSRSDLARYAPATLASLAPWVVRPRALTLTLWARLVVCNLFVHGIGGAKYDRINDGIFRRYYGCEPPPYACVTATLRLPLPHFPVERDDLLEARRRIRDFCFNPQRYIPNAPADLMAEREQLIALSAELRTSQATGAQRRKVFHAIRDLNQRMVSLRPELESDFEEQYRHVDRKVQSNAVADSREFFYALQPRDRLEMLATRLREVARAIPVQA